MANDIVGATGTISQREGYFELWSDMGAMIPPFPACGSPCNPDLTPHSRSKLTFELD